MTKIVPVSVVLPCYRCALTIERAVTSVVSQSARPFELILVDDGSGDATREVLIALQSRYAPDWFQLVLLDQNVGAASARNAGWDRAKGDYVAFLDADDAWHPCKLELQYQFMQAQPDVAVSGHGHIQVAAASSLGAWPLGAMSFREVSLLSVLLKNPFVTPSFMARRDLTHRFLAGRRHMEDHYFLMQVAAADRRIMKIALPLSVTFKNSFGATGLSASLWAMQCGELLNYDLLLKSKKISFFSALCLKTYSWLKFCRRLFIVFLRKLSALSDSRNYPSQ
jgi:glycosyltransferase involved in cell wall biosynthesis